VGLADALVHDPELLILDEPTNGLDPNQIRQIRDLIRQLADSHTVLISTHILHEVEMTCGRVIIIDNGKIKATDTPANLTQQMRAAGRIQCEIHAPADAAASAIHDLEHVKKVAPETLDDGWTRLTVWVDSGTDARERIARLAAQHDWPLRALFRHVATLEDVFVELTRKD
jgi:ABC-2 type transport system ATP-binding protein